MEHLIDCYENLIFNICYRTINDYFEAEDITQETFLAAYRHLKSFNGHNEKAWLCKIATNKCLDYWKKAERRNHIMEDVYFEALQGTEGTPEEQMLEADLKEKLREACRELKEPYQEVAILYYCEEMEIGEIAKKQGTNIKTVQTRYYRAKEILKKQYRKGCEDDTGTYKERTI